MSSTDQITERLVCILQRFGHQNHSDKTLPQTWDLTRDLHLCTSELVELLIGIEDEFSIEMPDHDDDLADVHTVGDLAALVNKKLTLQAGRAT